MTKRKRFLKGTAVVLSVVLALLVGVAGTLAYLMDSTDSVVNTFTSSDVNITLEETGAVNNAKSFKMVPGATIEKDPKITVSADSEDCYVFVKIEKSAVLTDYIDYDVASGWSELVGASTDTYDVYYCTVTDEQANKGVAIPVLAGTTEYPNGAVTVLDTVEKEDMEKLKVSGATQPTLTFTAYAIQLNNLPTGTDAAGAWALINPPAAG